MIVFIPEKENKATIKTGFRISRPIIPISHPNLIEELDIKNPKLPLVKCFSDKPKTITERYSSHANKVLKRWNSPVTQTHAFRNLANGNGIQADIPIEIRAASLGHTVSSNDTSYKKRFSIKTQVEMLTKHYLENDTKIKNNDIN